MTRRFRPFVQILEDRITPDAFTVNDGGDQPWDASKYPNDALTTGGMYTLRSVVQFVQAKNKSADITFNGPMTINTDLVLAVPEGNTLKVTGPAPGAGGQPTVSIVGPGSGTGFLLRTGSAVRNVRVDGYDFNIDILSGSSDITIENNFIGTDAGGTGPGAASKFGILVYSSSSNVGIKNNVVSGNSTAGISLGSSTDSTIADNKIGTDPAGTAANPNGYGLSNGVGIYFSGGGNGSKITDNIIGGNVGSQGKYGQGIYLNSASYVQIDGNLIGVGVDGTPLPNGIGISINSGSLVKIGAASGNTVSNNRNHGIQTSSATECELYSNTVESNEGDGIKLDQGSMFTVGKEGKGNTVGKNGGSGISLFLVDKTKVQANTVTSNTNRGISVLGSDNVIGEDKDTEGLNSKLGNDIRSNQTGVVVIGTNSARNTIRANRYGGNSGLDIDLGADGRDLIDEGDADTGPNDRLNAPAPYIYFEGTGVNIAVLARPNTTYRMDYYLRGQWIFTSLASYPDDVPFLIKDFTSAGRTQEEMGLVVATLTDPEGNTSEFSIQDRERDFLDDDDEALQAIDANGDGTPETTLTGASPNVPNIFLELDAMEGFAPLPGVVEAVVGKFAAHGINLIVEVSNTDIPRSALGADYWGDYHAIKSTYFGPSGTDTAEGKARLRAYRYVLFGDTYGDPTNPDQYFSPGAAELRGNDFFITLGSTSKTDGGVTRPGFADAYPADQRAQLQAGLLMHLLGHSLGLSQVGPTIFGETPAGEPPPDRASVMNPAREFPGSLNSLGQTAAFTLDYTTDEWNALWYLFPLSPWGQPATDRIAADNPNQFRELPGFGIAVPPAPTNATPVATADTAATVAATAKTIAVLANDTDADGDPLSVTGTTTPANGTVAVNADGTITYTSNAGFTGSDTFNYTIADGQGASATGTVTVTVNAAVPPTVPPNVPPTVPPSVAPPVLVGFREFAAGSDAGSPSVTLFNPDKTPRFTLTPFPGFTGGIRTAAGDFNGDGIADLVVGTGPGSATRVRVLDGVDQHELFAVDPFEAAFGGGVYLAVGDVTGDGIPDLVVTPDEGGGPRVDIYAGGTFNRVASFFGIDDPNFRGGARASTGDINGDGRADLIVAAGFGGGPRVAGFDGKSIGGTPAHLFGDFFAFEQTLRNGIFIAVGDIDGDGYAELICGGGPGGGPRVTAFGGKPLLTNSYDVRANFFGGDTDSRGGIRVAVKNLDDDARADVVVGAGTGAGSRVTAYFGKDIAAAGTPPTAFEFDAFSGSTAGVFVG